MRIPLPMLGVVFAACAPSSFEPGHATRADVLLEMGEPVLSFANDTELVYSQVTATDHVSAPPPEHFYRGRTGSLRTLREEHSIFRLPSAKVFVFDANGRLVRCL